MATRGQKGATGGLTLCLQSCRWFLLFFWKAVNEFIWCSVLLFCCYYICFLLSFANVIYWNVFPLFSDFVLFWHKGPHFFFLQKGNAVFVFLVLMVLHKLHLCNFCRNKVILSFLSNFYSCGCFTTPGSLSWKSLWDFAHTVFFLTFIF